MSQEIRSLILALVPASGSAVGNSSLFSSLRQQVPDLSDEDYWAARDQLIASGVLARGRGRGGSVYRVATNPPDLRPSDAPSTAAGDISPSDDESDQPYVLEADEISPGFVGAPRKASKRTRTSQSEPKQVLSYRHTETRANNPEVGMVHPDNDPDQPKTIWKYDPHLDPELMFDSQRGAVEKLIDDALASGDADAMRDALVELKRLQEPYLNWAGKAEGTSFAVDTVSLHVHERVDPATILANARKRLKGEKAGEAWRQADLFAAAFENLPLRQALDFYHHEKGWSNRLIAGDSLLVMNSLLHKESMAGKVQMIYIDPPYGIKYGSNFQPFTNKRDVKDGADADLTQEPEMIKAFRDTWELGIHSYLTYLRDRLLLAKELLHESGSVFVQISDENLHHVREIMDEVFEANNFVAVISFVKTAGQSDSRLAGVSDYLIWFAKDTAKLKYNQIYNSKVLGAEGASGYNRVQEPNGFQRSLAKNEDISQSALKAGWRIFTSQSVESQSPGTKYPVDFRGMTVNPSGYWKTQESSMPKLRKAGRLMVSGSTLRYIRFFDDFPVFPIVNLWQDTGVAGFSSNKRYVVETSTKVVERCLLMTTDPGDLVFDPTCGSGTTAFVAEKWGRRWITCDTSRVSTTLAKQRLMTSSFDYYHLRYPQEGLRGGFEYQTVPHIKLKSIANNQDIDTIYDAKHPAIESALNVLNDALLEASASPIKVTEGARKGKTIKFSEGQRLEEWEVPFAAPEDWPETVGKPFADFHVARLAMQAEMDRSIAAHAKPEPLYDKPKVDETRLRITGPFSVEAVPAPTVLSLDESSPTEQADVTVARSGETSRQTQWRDELIRTGIRAKGGAMLKFTDLEAIPGVKHLHASGTLDSGERVVVSFGPEHAALEQKQVERAIEDAQTLVPKPKFVVFCAFTFDPEAAKDVDELNWPGVTLLKAQMNTDLLTEDLKKARSSNQSFWLMGQPEVELKPVGGNWQVEVHGFDYFDPREGALVSGGKSKIAMWSLDTDYDGRSLMPHQVFFPMAGAKDGWNRLKKTIRAELDEDLLEQFHGTVSLPFEAGDHRRVAVKIVDDRGIESLKIMNLE